MIQVLVPKSSGSPERGENNTGWTPAEASCLSEYPIFPINEPINLDYGVTVGRNRTYPEDPISNDNFVRIKTHGDTKVLFNGQIFSRESDHLDLENGVALRREFGRKIFVIMEPDSECLLEVKQYDRVVATAKLVVVSEEKAKKIIENESAIDQRWVAQYSDGTSDFG